MGNDHGPGIFFIILLIRLWLAQEKFRSFFSKFSRRKDACQSFNFLPGFEFRFRDAGAQAAAWSAAAFVLPIDEEGQQVAAATVGLDEYARAGAASEFLDVKASVEGNELHAVPNSDGLETVFGLHGASRVAATDLPVATIMDGLGCFS